ncbi:Leucine-rich repeat serine/threonine-protein kinase 2 [Phytophthora boehmeriae]|uniref:Leucine-rich repeat serine/threonine-protein kinase 2 n=1 Tax=Phytophthora boehmeriae TaxID=109152 RepID=A0A8T1WLJ2_9STRA|nr:Leucine-rich repeat serine/threonine-protein kinase 2 [Phytophthora boehmeriae]
MKLARHGEIVLVLERAMEAALGILDLLDTSSRDAWYQQLQRERDEQMKMYEGLLTDDEKLMTEAGGEDQQLEILTILKHSFDRDGDLLTQRELDVTSFVYDAIARRANVIAVTSPKWLSTSEYEWSFSEMTPVEDEENCIREAIIWEELNHPNILKIYGACHVGEPGILHEANFISVHPCWKEFLGCARALRYMHDRGFVHCFFSVENLRSSKSEGGDGVLVGFGLVPLNEAFRYGIIYNTWVERQGDDVHPTVASDVLAFGHHIFEYLLYLACDYDEDKTALLAPSMTGRLPYTRPEFLNEDEWNLLQNMCADVATERASMADIITQIEVLAALEASNDDDDGDNSKSKVKSEANTPATVQDTSTYEIQSLGLTLQGTLDELKELCADLPEFGDVNDPVYARLLDVYKQLQKLRTTVPESLVENFSVILLRFYDILDKRAYPSESIVASVCAARTVAGKNFSIHHDIDRLIFTSPLLSNGAVVHRWEPIWKMARDNQSEVLATHLEDPSSFLDQLEESSNREEALALLQFEARNHIGARSAPSVLATQHDVTETTEGGSLPPWFIPPYQVTLDKHAADGSFGAVYYGQWLDTDVVVKQVTTDQLDRANRLQFRHEANLWFGLNHVNLVKLYGACHEGRPFFVCERASEGTIGSYLKGKGRWEIWDSIRDAARGLKHLHDHSIIHGDLKGNNILVCDDGLVKLADFGLSSVANRDGVVTDGLEGALGAFRWKAPECILGARPTFASDIFSLGMCVIEIVTGDFPWGKDMSDAAVKFNVAEKKLIPPRPESFNDTEWDLVARMCKFDPQQRISAGAVVSFVDNMR